MTTARCLLVLALAAVVALGVPASARAAGGFRLNQGDQIVLSGAVTVPRGAAVDEVVVLRGRVTIQGVATGDVVVLDGPIVVQGQVSGSVVAMNGSVDLGPNAQVRGDVIASGDVNVEAGAKVAGRIRQHASFTLREPLRALGGLLSWLAVSVSTLLLGLLLLLVAPRAAEAVSDAARSAPWASLGWGVALFLGIPIVAVALVATILGLPLGLVVLFALALVLSIGYVWSAWALGRLLWRPPTNRGLALLFGWGILRALSLIPWVGGATLVAGSVFGLGAMSVATWRARATGGRHREGRAPRAAAPMGEELGL